MWALTYEFGRLLYAENDPTEKLAVKIYFANSWNRRGLDWVDSSRQMKSACRRKAWMVRNGKAKLEDYIK